MADLAKMQFDMGQRNEEIGHMKRVAEDHEKIYLIRSPCHSELTTNFAYVEQLMHHG